jgi:hypothetical protein
MAKRLIATAAIGPRIAGSNAPAEKGFRCQATRGSRQRTTACHVFPSLRRRGHRSEKWGSRRARRCALASKRTQILVVTNSALLADALSAAPGAKAHRLRKVHSRDAAFGSLPSRRAYFVKERVDTVIVTGCNTSGCIRATSMIASATDSGPSFRRIARRHRGAAAQGQSPRLSAGATWADLSCLPREMAQKERALRYS